MNLERTLKSLLDVNLILFLVYSLIVVENVLFLTFDILILCWVLSSLYSRISYLERLSGGLSTLVIHIFEKWGGWDE